VETIQELLRRPEVRALDVRLGLRMELYGQTRINCGNCLKRDVCRFRKNLTHTARICRYYADLVSALSDLIERVGPQRIRRYLDELEEAR